MDNIIASKLYRAGSVGYVSKSGGMSNELNNILSLVTNGTYEGIAIGGDRYPGSTFIDHLLRYEQDPDCKMLVLLGEVGGIEEYRVIEAVKAGTIKKPIVAWAIGTCAKMFTTEVQFGHAGSMANSELETADAKNKAMRAAGFVVPETFEELPHVLKATYEALVRAGTIRPAREVEPPVIPMDYKWAQELGLIRKPAAFISTISDERGQELLYAGMRISDVFKEDIGLGGVVSLLWFKRREWFANFFFLFDCAVSLLLSLVLSSSVVPLRSFFTFFALCSSLVCPFLSFFPFFISFPFPLPLLPLPSLFPRLSLPSLPPFLPSLHLIDPHLSLFPFLISLTPHTNRPPTLGNQIHRNGPHAHS
jgi:hypothetical protein